MANNIVFEECDSLELVVTDPAAPDAGDPVRFGNLTGVAIDDESGTKTVVKIGTFVATLPVNDHGGAGITAGDSVFYVDAADRLENDSSGYFFGFALEAVGAGLTATIRVLHVQSPGSGTLGAGTVGAANLAANAVETAKINANAVTGAKFSTGVIKVSVADGTAAAADVAIAAIAAADEIVAVLAFATKAAIATMNNRTSEYAAKAGGLTKAAGTDETNNQLLVIWVDKT